MKIDGFVRLNKTVLPSLYFSSQGVLKVCFQIMNLQMSHEIHDSAEIRIRNSLTGFFRGHLLHVTLVMTSR